MDAALAWKPPRSAMSNNFSGLLDRLAAQHGIADIDASGFQVFMDGAGAGVLLLTEEPDTAAESWDMAVIFPELLAAMGVNLRAAVMRPEPAREMQIRFGVARLPALLFLRDGAYVGTIEGLRDWSDFIAECSAMLQKPASRVPSIGIAVAAASPSACQ